MLIKAGLTPGQARVLSHLARFRVSTMAVIQALMGIDREAAKSMVRRLREHRPPLIASAPLDATGRSYYFLTPASWAMFGAARSRKVKPLAPMPLMRHIGALLFCQRSSSREKLTEREFAERYPSLVASDLENRWYYEDFEDDGQPKLGLIHVNCGGTPKSERHKFRGRIIGRRLENHAWRVGLINPGGFAVAVLAANAEKLAELRDALELTWPEVTFRFEAVPELEAIRDFGGGSS